jgi:hypothetical protein
VDTCFTKNPQAISLFGESMSSVSTLYISLVLVKARLPVF